MKEYKVKSGTVILRSDDIVELINDKDWNETDTLEVARNITAGIREAIDGKPRGLMIEVPNRYTKREILKHYQNSELGAVARALILNSFATKVVGNLYLKLSKEKPNEAGRVVPTKLFTNKEEATKWLLEKMQEDES